MALHGDAHPTRGAGEMASSWRGSSFDGGAPDGGGRRAPRRGARHSAARSVLTEVHKTAGAKAVQSLSDRFWDLKTSRPKFLLPKERHIAPKYIHDNMGAIHVR